MTKLNRDDIQGNILEGYRYGHAAHLLIHVNSAHDGREFLTGLVAEVTTARSSPRVSGQELTLNIALTYAGLQRLGVPADSLTRLPLAFRQGMRERAQRLADTPDRWEAFWRTDETPIHLWVALHASSAARLEQGIAQIEAQLKNRGQLVTRPILGQALEENGYLIEHFGFRDGIANPSITGSRRERWRGGGKPLPNGDWAPIATGEFLLGYRDEAGDLPCYGPAWLVNNGTFSVFRVLEQDVIGFRRFLDQSAAQLGRSAETLAAKMVGRAPDGSPLVRSSSAHTAASAGEAIAQATNEQLNDFRYASDHGGAACPLGAHVRRANLRDASGFPNLVARHRLIRRGMPYGPRLTANATSTGESDSQTEGREHMNGEPTSISNPPLPPTRQRGLLFICMNASIERQFEFVQSRWLNDGASVHQAKDRDPLVSPQAPGGGRFIVQGDADRQQAPVICQDLPNFVQCLGGEYFFMPSLSALRHLGAGTHAQTQPAHEPPVAHP